MDQVEKLRREKVDRLIKIADRVEFLAWLMVKIAQAVLFASGAKVALEKAGFAFW